MQTQNSDVILLIIASTVMLLFLLSFIAAILFLYQKKSILYFKDLEDVKNKHEKNLLQTQLEIQEQTFQNISREIHDNIGLSLTLAKLQLNTIKYDGIQNIQESVDSSTELIGKAINDLSDISKSFNSEAIKNQGLYSTLKAETEKINRSGKYKVDFAEQGDIVFLDAQKELVLYRIAQEALNNILKHAAATCIWIRLIYESHSVSLIIEDNGIGFDKETIENQRSGSIHTGLVNMRMRASTLNGEYTVTSTPGKGTFISISIPY